MSFVMPKEAKAFFRPIIDRSVSETKFIMFDAYYACLMVGLDARRLGPKEDLENDKFVEGYPQDFADQANVIAGALIDAELARPGITEQDASSVEHVLVTLLDPNAPSRLSVEGLEMLNRYAAGGFKLLRDGLTAQPHSLDEFLVAFHDFMARQAPT